MWLSIYSKKITLAILLWFFLLMPLIDKREHVLQVLFVAQGACRANVS